MNFMTSALARMLSNKHTTGAGIVYGINWGLSEILPIWFPEHKDKILSTSEIIRKGCFMYATFMSADSKNLTQPVPLSIDQRTEQKT